MRIQLTISIVPERAPYTENYNYRADLTRLVIAFRQETATPAARVLELDAESGILILLLPDSQDSLTERQRNWPFAHDEITSYDVAFLSEDEVEAKISSPRPRRSEETLQQDKLPLNITFVVMQHREPNEHWYDIIPFLSWEEEFSQRMDTMMCGEDQIDKTKEGVCFLLGERFGIREVREVKAVQTCTRGQIVKIQSMDGTMRVWNDVGIGIDACSEEEYQRVLRERDFLNVAFSFFPKEQVQEVLPSA
jgi:hypothetical protein